jgi:hypothetical protein
MTWLCVWVENTQSDLEDRIPDAHSNLVGDRAMIAPVPIGGNEAHEPIRVRWHSAVLAKQIEHTPAVIRDVNVVASVDKPNGEHLQLVMHSFHGRVLKDSL